MKYCIAGVFIFSVILGCRTMAHKPSFSSSGDGASVTMSELVPDASPGTKAILVLGGVRAPVEVVRTRTGDELTLDLKGHGESFETEAYSVMPTEFGLSNAGGELFTPAIPLLKSPMKVGDTWSWKGSMMSGISRPAEASVSCKVDKVYTEQGLQEDALMVEVKLKMDSGTKAPAERRLAYWFVKGKGVLKREIGSGSTRLPDDGK